MAELSGLGAEALVGAVLGLIVVAGLVAGRVPRWSPLVVAVVGVLAVLPYGLRRDGSMLAGAAVGGALLIAVLMALRVQYRSPVIGLLLSCSLGASALATPDTEAVLLLAGLFGLVSLAGWTVRRPVPLSWPTAVVTALAWALAVAHGSGGRPSSMVGAVAAWAVMAGLALAVPWTRGRPPAPVALVVVAQLALAPWVARLVGLRADWWSAGRDTAVVWVSVAVASVLVRRASGGADDGDAVGHGPGDHGAGADGGVVADLTAR